MTNDNAVAAPPLSRRRPPDTAAAWGYWLAQRRFDVAGKAFNPYSGGGCYLAGLDRARMRYLLLLLVASFVLGCDQPATTKSAAAGALPEAEPAVAACALPVYELRNLQPPTARRLDSVQVAGLYAQDPDLRRVLETYYPEEHVYALDTVRCAGFALLTVYHVDESGHYDLYYFTLDAAVRRVRQAVLVAAWGSDGGWSGETTMQRRGRRLRVSSADAVDDEASTDEYTTRTTDSVVVDYHLSPAGQLMLTRVDSSRQVVHTRNP